MCAAASSPSSQRSGGARSRRSDGRASPGFLQRHARTVLALWFLLTDDGGEACRWQDIGDATTNQVLARGGDVVVVSFVNAEGAHAE